MDNQKLDKEIEKLRGDIDMARIDRVAKSSRIISIIVLPVVFALFIYGSVRLNTLYKEIRAQEAIKQKNKVENDALQFEIAALEEKKMKLESELMNQYGLSVDSIRTLSSDEILEHAILANDAIKNLVKGYSPGRNVEVQYYNKTIDEKRLVLELEALGYKFLSRPPSQYMSKKQTNALWFGSEVPLKDVKIVALAMIRAGVPLRGIRPYRSSSSNPAYKSNIIEVGASVDLEQKPLLTGDEVKNATDFKR